MRNRIIFATTNEGKLKEIRLILKDLDYDIISMKDAGICIDIVEDGSTFEENAIIKARTIMELTGEMVLADDSGLEVDAMDKAPGIYSARFLGETTSYDIKNNYILDQLKGLPLEERSARFVCVIACAFPDGEIVTKRATIEGFIGNEIAGDGGFGYDPIFWVPEYGCTSAELSTDIKNKISHRGKALEAMKDVIRAYEKSGEKISHL
ncbi:XTP/dITP diphosphatase [Anaerocolumna sp. AGMB13025]|uniref:XTP/dITP diphosphatase n=1 Tax=Anaerocolumna sp. AGMB13025 TaxID=3039116 RepID=UPI00241F2F61|nr:XTP/dITP diphosphatase [Anaerocolumna sp. AGMB13025]WFR57929.1 XTP/dITP diphosphatase [Anaerocolumna sp. AGMB13025]